MVPGADTLLFRGVQGVSDRVAYLLSIGSGADSRIYKTTDRGATWTMQFQNQDPSAFYDRFGRPSGLAQTTSEARRPVGWWEPRDAS